MEVLRAAVLGLVQGATEFIPVSSSGHLVLVPWLLGWPSPSLSFDTVLHLGTLLALLVVFWRELLSLAGAWLRSLRARQGSDEARIAWWIVLGTLPAVLAGLLWEEKVEALFQRPLYVAVMLLVTGTWLVLAERLGQRQRSAQDLSWWQSVLVGVAQGVALAPGISRSGSTIGAGLLLGLRREAAARFSFLLAIPIVFGAGLLQVRRLLEASNAGSQLLPLLVGFAAAAGSGYVCIRFLLRYLRQRSLLVFAAYCWLAGLATLLLSLR